ncbi:hypothetical protein Aple_100490 [Acrocarpospora pleiomorpha]|uniref:Uncharacterized protein n=1 Tax=Acrocarpospora pleiomorpha TaxID=90975 RepID=A0A5M3Y1M0_9ACTN|nr:hypothetical protein Aple_100490 [Acrocarpospora pleiomorpha]
MGSAKEVAIGNGCRTGPEDTMGEGCGGTTVSDGSGGDAGGWVALTSDTRSAAGSAHPAARTARTKPASAADERDDM